MTVPPGAVEAFGERLPVARRYAEILTTTGIEHGLLGPREADRIWSRHLLNCVVLVDLIPAGARVVDVGSGAGLPGLVVAIRRPDLQVQLVEPLLRRAEFLTATVTDLELDGQVSVVRGRAEENTVRQVAGDAEWVTARAVAPLDRLVGWCLPLLRAGGSLLAMKGSSASAEISEHASSIRRMGGEVPRLVTCEAAFIEDPVRVVVVRRR